MSSLAPFTVVADEAGIDYASWLTDFEEPYDTEYNFLRALYDTASRQGKRVVLDGGGGDIVLGEGSYVPRLIRQGRIRLALAEIRGEIDFWQGGSVTESVLRYGRAAFVPAAIKQAVRRHLPANSDKELMQGAMIAPELAERVDLRDQSCGRYRETFARGWTSDYALESCNAIRPNVTAGRERYARIAAGRAIEACDPFLDRRLIDFCTRLPGHFRMRGGWYKRILRDVTAGLLPDEVRWMRGKPHIGWAFSAAVNAAAIDDGTLNLAALHSELEGLVDPEELDRAWEQFHQNTDPDRLQKAHALSIWLRENRNRPVVSNAAIR